MWNKSYMAAIVKFNSKAQTRSNLFVEYFYFRFTFCSF